MSVPGWQEHELLELGRRVRKQTRTRMGAMRRALPASAVALRSASIIRQLEASGLLAQVRAVGSFWPLDGQAEVDLRALDEALMHRGIARFYPFMDPSERGHVTGFRRIERREDLAERGQKFLEPPRDAPVARRGDLDLVLVPALAVTPDGQRLGQGSGFYDVTLPDVCPPALSVVVAYSFQLLGELPLEAHDVACDLVITDREVLDPRGILAARSSG